MLATAFTAMTVSDAERERERLAGQDSQQGPQTSVREDKEPGQSHRVDHLKTH